jgi:hypothetical protein
MHDIDRTQREKDMETEHANMHHEHNGEYEGEYEAGIGSVFHELEGEQAHAPHEAEHEAESPLSESQEMALASELLETTNEAELEYFFGNLLRKVAGGVKKFANSTTGKFLIDKLKGVAKKALPGIATAAGSFLGGPLGAKIGGSLGNYAAGLFELELEGLSHEDRELEVARQIVRLGAAAANRALQAPSTSSPYTNAQRALTSAARLYAPGMVRKAAHCTTCAAAASRGGSIRQRRARRYPGSGRPGFGATRVIGGVAGPTYIEASASAGEPDAGDAGDGDGDPTAMTGGRWFRRGRNIVLTGL